MQELEKAIEILNKLSFFGGQRAGRELWNEKPRKIQDEDIASFNRDIEHLKGTIRKHMNDGWIPIDEDNIPDHEVLVCNRYAEELIGYIGKDESGFYCESDGEVVGYVTAWMEKAGAVPYRNERGRMKYIASWSGGKDSTASIVLAHEHNEPLDLIIFSEVMFDKTTSGELPEHIDFVKNKAIPIFESWGYETKILHSNKTYMDCFHHRTIRGKNIGKKRDL